jgi:hypothetical protein
MNGPDEDGDGLGDCSEETYNTDKNDPDTDGDAFSDYEELNPNAPYPESNPLRTDVYVEVDYRSVGSYTLYDELAPVRQAYSDAPVSNPNGENGIDLHTRIDDEIDENKDLSYANHVNLDSTVSEQYRDYLDHGYIYLAVAPGEYKYEDGDEVISSANPWGNGYGVVIQREVGGGVASTFMHELGHTRGLLPESYKGIDSNKVAYDEGGYKSVMNYNSPGDAIVYNDGEPYDDWDEAEEPEPCKPRREEFCDD